MSTNYLFIGNPGTGKSTLINGLCGEVVMDARVSFTGRGITYKFNSRMVDGVGRVMDTPGLADDDLKHQAAKAIEQALKSGGFFRIFFVLTEVSGRIRPEDKTTMKLILDAAPTLTRYSIIVNKVHSNWKNTLLQNEAYFTDFCTYLLEGLPRATMSFYFMEKMDKLDYKDNVEYEAPLEIAAFIKSAPGMEIKQEDVGEVKADAMEYLKREFEEQYKKLDEDKKLLEEKTRAIQKAMAQQAEENAAQMTKMEAQLEVQARIADAKLALEREAWDCALANQNREWEEKIVEQGKVQQKQLDEVKKQVHRERTRMQDEMKTATEVQKKELEKQEKESEYRLKKQEEIMKQGMQQAQRDQEAMRQKLMKEKAEQEAKANERQKEVKRVLEALEKKEQAHMGRASLGSKKCEWCQLSCEGRGGHVKGQISRGHQLYWCRQCDDKWKEQKKNRDGKIWACGLMVGCRGPVSGEGYLLFGLQCSGEWCNFHGGAEEKDLTNIRVAIREGCEELCYALGSPRLVQKTYFDTKNYSKLCGNTYFIDLGYLTQQERQDIVNKHYANMYEKRIFRGWLRHCEKEMQAIKWCKARDFADAVKGQKGTIVVKSLGRRFRGICKGWYHKFFNSKKFTDLCKKPLPKPA